jgi:uroporphyrinogen III methyltransferase/synthase
MDDALPLAGFSVLVTRPREQAAAFVRRLEELGAEVFVLPVMAIDPPEDWAAADSRLGQLSEYDWLVFSSANGVEAFFARLAVLQVTAPAELRIAVVGPSTALVLSKFERTADLVPAIHRAEDLVAELAPQAMGKRILIVRGDRSRDVLRRELTKISLADEVIVYRQRDVVDRSDPVFARMADSQIDFVTLTSPNIARAFLQSLDDLASERIRSETVHLVSISPLTSATIREVGFPVAVEARQYTIEGMTDVLIEYVRST